MLALLGRGCAGEALLAGCDGTVFLPGQPRFSSNGTPSTHQSSGNGGGDLGAEGAARVAGWTPGPEGTGRNRAPLPRH